VTVYVNSTFHHPLDQNLKKSGLQIHYFPRYQISGLWLSTTVVYGLSSSELEHFQATRKANDKGIMLSNMWVLTKGALAIECQTYTWLVSPAEGLKKKMEVSTTQAQDHCRASY